MVSSNEKIEIKTLYRILVVDDEVRILEIMSKLLKNTSKFDCVVSTAERADEAKRLLQKGIYDMIITDQKMPETSGIELLEDVKEKYPSTLRMLITGYSDLDTAKEAINKAEVDCFIEKPWDNEELLDNIFESLKNKYMKQLRENTYQARDVREAISVIEEAIEAGPKGSERYEYRGVQSLGKSRISENKMLRFEFRSVSDFNKFPFELKHLDLGKVEIRIEDFRVYDHTFTVTVSLSFLE